MKIQPVTTVKPNDVLSFPRFFETVTVLSVRNIDGPTGPLVMLNLDNGQHRVLAADESVIVL